jgi:hypothetical protein
LSLIWPDLCNPVSHQQRRIGQARTFVRAHIASG